MNSQVCPREMEIKLVCPCPKTACENHSRCCLCIAAHRKSDKPTYCMARLVDKK
ncbi:MAG TPA: hypothetical protein PKA10_17400 [Selenomonadales bacterium]|nr:hypothetical protein [Selenomonadales bacterium]